MAVKLIISSTCDFKGTVIAYVEYYFSKNFEKPNCRAHIVSRQAKMRPTVLNVQWMGGNSMKFCLYLVHPSAIQLFKLPLYSALYMDCPLSAPLFFQIIWKISGWNGEMWNIQNKKFISGSSLRYGYLSASHKGKSVYISFSALGFCIVQCVTHSALAPKRVFGK